MNTICQSLPFTPRTPRRRIGGARHERRRPRAKKSRADRVKQILNGTRSITGDTALRLAHFFGTSAQLWLNLQSFYDLRLAEQRADKATNALPKLKRSESVHAGIAAKIEIKNRDKFAIRNF